MLARTFSAAIQGVDAYAVEIEVNASGVGEDAKTIIVGLPDAAVRESRERVSSALMASGFFQPYGRTTINLAPADVKKQGSAFDLGIAVGMIAAGGELERKPLESAMILGELALDGSVRTVPGVLPAAMHAREMGLKTILVPVGNVAEAGIVSGIQAIGVGSLYETVQWLRGELEITPTITAIDGFYEAVKHPAHDFADIKGQNVARRALEIAAAGGHNVLMIGPPGTGKTMLAERLPSILPLMDLEEAMEVTKIHSVAGQLDRSRPLIVERPFRSPHHTISNAGLLGGQSTPTPGEVSLAHNGVLFLDELTEFQRSALEVMRQPLESGDVTISRAAGSFTFPANFQLVAAMNPCPCGFYGSTQRQCRCTSSQIARYRGRLSGPLLDRIDIHTEVAPISEKELLSKPDGEPSTAVRERVETARARQAERFAGTPARCNADMTSRQINDCCVLTDGCKQLLRLAISDMNLSARAYDRILRVARTLADLAGADTIAQPHIAEAVQFRTLDRQMW